MPSSVSLHTTLWPSHGLSSSNWHLVDSSQLDSPLAPTHPPRWSPSPLALAMPATSLHTMVQNYSSDWGSQACFLPYCFCHPHWSLWLSSDIIHSCVLFLMSVLCLESSPLFRSPRPFRNSRPLPTFPEFLSSLLCDVLLYSLKKHGDLSGHHFPTKLIKIDLTSTLTEASNCYLR